MVTIVKFALAIAAALAGFNLQASTVIATFNNELTSESITRDVGDGAGPIVTTTGMFSFTRTGGTLVGSPTGTFDAFCTEPREFVTPGDTYTYDFSDLSAGATNIGGMGVAKATLIDELFGRYYPVIGAPIDAEHASALQIAIWEIVRENSGTLDVYHGNVVFSNPQDPDALNLAQSYVQSLDGTGPHLTNLYALTAIGVQDVIVQIPEPVEAFATGLALIAIALIARARRCQRPSR
jgi:hypothetical protein